MYCEKCGNPIEDGSTFCGYCGEPIKPFGYYSDYQESEQLSNSANQTTSTDKIGYHYLVVKAEIPNNKWPISVRITMIISLLIILIEYFTVIFVHSNNWIYGWFDIIPPISSLVATICFFMSKKRIVISFVPLVLMIIWYFIKLRYLDLSWQISKYSFVAFAILFIIYVLLQSHYKNIAFPIILAVLIIPIVIPFFEMFIYALRWFYGIELMLLLFMVFFLITYTIAAFSLLPKKEKKPLPAYQQQQTINKFCPSCGIQYASYKKFCDQCGGALKEVVSTAEPNPQSSAYPQQNPMDAPSGGYAALGFFIPIVGLILFLTWKDQYPLRARSAGKGALIGFIVYVLLSIAAAIIPFIIVGSSFGF